MSECLRFGRLSAPLPASSTPNHNPNHNTTTPPRHLKPRLNLSAHHHFHHTNQLSTMSASDIQEKIAAARREAETLKEKIRAKREQLADTSRK